MYFCKREGSGDLRKNWDEDDIKVVQRRKKVESRKEVGIRVRIIERRREKGKKVRIIEMKSGQVLRERKWQKGKKRGKRKYKRGRR